MKTLLRIFLPIGAVIGAGWLLQDGSFGVNTESILVLATPILNEGVFGILEFVKTKLASMVVTSTLSKIKTELGEEDYKLATTLVKDVGIKEGVKIIKLGIENIDKLVKIIPLIQAIGSTQLALGIYDDYPVTKEIVEKVLNES